MASVKKGRNKKQPVGFPVDLFGSKYARIFLPVNILPAPGENPVQFCAILPRAGAIYLVHPGWRQPFVCGETVWQEDDPVMEHILLTRYHRYREALK